jgi:hypothetical protein
MEFLIAVQGWIRQSITADLNAFAANRDWAALILILPLGIVFGAVHALTPGTARRSSPRTWSGRGWRSFAASASPARSP